MLLPCGGTGLNTIKRFCLHGLYFHLLDVLAILLFVWGILRRFRCVQIFLSKYYNGSTSQIESVYNNGTFMGTSDQLLKYRVTCKCRKIKIAHGTIQYNRIHSNSFNTRLSYNLPAVTILSRATKKTSRLTRTEQSDAQKAQFQSCYACKKRKMYSADKQKQIP